MLDFIVKYWLEVAFGLITLAVSAGVKHYLTLERKAFNTRWEEREKEIREQILQKVELRLSDEESAFKKADKELYNEIEKLN